MLTIGGNLWLAPSISAAAHIVDALAELQPLEDYWLPMGEPYKAAFPSAADSYKHKISIELNSRYVFVKDILAAEELQRQRNEQATEREGGAK